MRSISTIKKISNSNPLIMGILNITPDSFSDGGKYFDPKFAIKKAIKMKQEGADIIDIGGESTGPGSKKISTTEEINRIIPVLKEIRKQIKIPISIDTYKSKVANEALKNGANLINDITAFRGDPKLSTIIAQYKCPIIMMHSKDSNARTTIKNKEYKDVIKTIKTFFQDRISFAKKQGIKQENIIIDPGLGHFISSNPKYSYEIIAKLSELKVLKSKILIGISRKSFIGGSIAKRDEKAPALSAIAHINGASIIRTHDVKGIKNFFKILE